MVLPTVHLQVRNTYIIYTDLCPHKLHSSNVKESKNKPILSAVATHSWLALLEIGSKLNVKQTLNGSCAPLLHTVPQVCLKLPMPMDTDLHVGGCEANQNSVTMPQLKQRLVGRFRPKNSLRSHITEHQSSKTFSREACPQTHIA